MGTLTSNDVSQNRGLVKITDGVEFADVTVNGELKISSTDINPVSIPSTYTKKTETTSLFPMIPGTLTKLKIRPEVLNEHVESSREILDTVTSLVTVGQIFKASQDNINSLYLTMESAAAETVIDDIEYAGNNISLQAVWILTGINLAITESAIVSPNELSTESMKLPMAIVADEWRITILSTDFTGAIIEFDYFQDKESTKTTMTLSLRNGAGANVVTLAVPKALKGTWQHFSIPATSFIGTTDITTITDIFFTVTLTGGKATENAYVDNFRVRPAPGSIQLELWDMGTTLPANNGTINYTTVGTQYTELGDRGISGIVSANINLTLNGGKQTYHIQEFVAGVAKEIPTNTLLTINNYYALVIKYVDTDVSIFGPDTTFSTNYYTNGYAWKAEVADNLIDLSQGVAGAGVFSDLMFSIFSTQDIYLEEMEIKIFDNTNTLVNSGLNTEALFHIEDSNMKMTVISNEHFVQSQHEENFSNRPLFLEKGGKAEIYYSSSIDDTVTTGIIEIKFLYIPPTING